jgi:hypothetical protein
MRDPNLTVASWRVRGGAATRRLTASWKTLSPRRRRRRRDAGVHLKTTAQTSRSTVLPSRHVVTTSPRHDASHLLAEAIASRFYRFCASHADVRSREGGTPRTYDRSQPHKGSHSSMHHRKGSHSCAFHRVGRSRLFERVGVAILRAVDAGRGSLAPQ